MHHLVTFVSWLYTNTKTFVKNNFLFFADAVASAKQSNIDAINFLKNQLEKINENIVYLEGYQKNLDEENAELQ